jgi:hypothetical protein
MPNGVFPVPRFQPRQSPGPGLSLRLRTLWQRDRLDYQLARGVDPAESDQLELRAQQLLRSRTDLATAIEGVVERAHRPARFSVEVPLRRAEVRAGRDDLLALARRLRSSAPIDVDGVAMTSNLLTDASSPLYLDGGISLRHAVRSARLALDPKGVSARELAIAA